MATTIRYESQNVSAEPLSRSLHFEFSGKTAPNRLYAWLHRLARQIFLENQRVKHADSITV